MKRLLRFLLPAAVLLGMVFCSAALADMVYTEAVVNADDVAFRVEPRSGSKIYSRLANGTHLELLGTNFNCEWHKVRYKNRVGYVNRMYVDLLGVSTGDCFTGTVVNCAEYVNVRATADKKGELLGNANLGEEYALASTSIENGYYAIDFNGQTGYIATDYLKLIEQAQTDQLSQITVTGGTLSPDFSPDRYGYVVRVTDDSVTIAAEAEKGVRISVNKTKKSTCTVEMPETGTKTIRIQVNGNVRYTLYLVRNVTTLCSYNIKRGNKRLAEMGQLVVDESPDIMGLQECYRIPATENNEAVNDLLALRTSHMQEWTFAMTVSYPSGGEYGIGMLSCYEMKHIETKLLTSPEKEQRACIRAVVEIDGKTVSVYNTHLSYESAEIRNVQLTEIAEWMKEDESPYRILFGDFNISSVSEFAPLTGMKCVDDDKTRFFDFDGTEFSSNRIDNILVTDNIKVLNVRKVNKMISDHRPLIAYVVFE